MEQDDEYAALTKKPLKLSKSKPEKGEIIITTTTKAEEAFKTKQEKLAEARILKKASKSHKQRVEDFNKHLDSLSEHYDIPKVSWTK